MNRKTKLFAALVLSPLFFLITAGPCRALDLIASGAWALRGSGKIWSSPSPAIGSGGGDVLLSVVGVRGGESWKIVASLGDWSMPEGIRIWVRRGGTGQGTGWIDGGLVFVPVGGREAALFTGTGDRMQIPLEIKIDGINPATPSGSLRGELRFKAVNLR